MDDDTLTEEKRIDSLIVDANVGLSQGIVYGSIAMAGELYQMQVQAGNADYTWWWTGHLSNLAAPAAVTAPWLSLSSENNNPTWKSKIWALLSPPLYFTLGEFIQGRGTSKYTFDPQDIACYFAGSLAAYGIFEGIRKAREYISLRRQPSTLEETVL